jgi:2-oxoglutarate ferredoxin oxidoreductase subunit beta
VEEILLHDGTRLRLRKLEQGYDPHDRVAAMAYLQERHAAGEIVTGLLYLEAEPADLHDYLNTVERPINQLSDAELCPGAEALQRINAALR